MTCGHEPTTAWSGKLQPERANGEVAVLRNNSRQLEHGSALVELELHLSFIRSCARSSVATAHGTERVRTQRPIC